MTTSSDAVAASGVPGLDAVLRGGFPRERLHLIQGGAGTGKTTLGLQFVMAGVALGESCLYLTLAETVSEVRAIAASHGWDPDDVTIAEQPAVGLGTDEPQTVLHPAEIELPATVNAILEQIETHRPLRVVVDSLSELRILAREPRWFRRELMRIRDRLARMRCTALLLDTEEIAAEAESLLGSVLRLERHTPDYGPDRRRLRVVKIRGHEFETGYHDMKISRGGIWVYPRLVAAEHRDAREAEIASTGLPELDQMLDGGLDRGTAVLLLGTTGTGKSTLALQCAAAAAARGERAIVYVLDERIHTVLLRARGLGIPLEKHLDSGRIAIRQKDPAEQTPGEFAEELKASIEEHSPRVVVLDSLNAYLHAMTDERFLQVHLHELLSFLSQKGVISVLVGTQHGLSSASPVSRDFDISYLADTVIQLRKFEIAGHVRNSVSVYKRRAGSHETTVRELQLRAGDITIGDVLPITSVPSSSVMDLTKPGSGGPERRA